MTRQSESHGALRTLVESSEVSAALGWVSKFPAGPRSIWHLSCLVNHLKIEVKKLGVNVAENDAEKNDEKEAAAEPTESGAAKKAKPPILLLGLVVINTMVILGVGYLLYSSKKSDLKKPSLEPIVQGGQEDRDLASTKEDSGFSVPLDYFLVNLAEDQGQKLFKVEMEFDVNNVEVQEEINKRMPQVRDIIIILLSSKKYSQISTPRGKENLKEEIRDTVNSFLTKGKINKVLFTQFINS